jgi:pimeloyl-ACP methyl ester carboxylesterase
MHGYRQRRPPTGPQLATHPPNTHTRALSCADPPPSQLDWRALLRHIRLPCLNCAGGTSGVFPLEGLLEVGRLVPDCCSVVFDRANHWLYVEQPAEFNELLLDFVRRGNEGRAKLAHVP